MVHQFGHGHQPLGMVGPLCSHAGHACRCASLELQGAEVRLPRVDVARGHHGQRHGAVKPGAGIPAAALGAVGQRHAHLVAAGLQQHNVSRQEPVELSVNQIFAPAPQEKQNFAEFVVMELCGNPTAGGQMEEPEVLRQKALLGAVRHGDPS